MEGVDVLPSLDPKPVLRLHLNDISHSGSTAFLSLVDGTRLLPNCIRDVLRHLYATYPGSSVPQTRSVTLVLRNMEGVAYTTRLELDELHTEIHFNLGWICKQTEDKKRCRDEIIGVVTHEMVHCYQYNSCGTAPGGLIEGIADFVRLKAGLAPPHWESPKKEPGAKWDAGYQKTAYFLDWLEQEYGRGTVGRINGAMRDKAYNEQEFWEGLFGKGKGVEILWQDYRDSLEDAGGEDKTAVQVE